MTLISHTIPNMINGVSQQPASLRHTSQCEESINMNPSVVEGLTPRNPTEYHAKLSATSFGSVKLHTINRDTTERYKVVISNGDLRVFDINGTEKTVSFPDGKDYLATTTPKVDFKALTVADYTFITNKAISATMDASSIPTSRGVEAIVLIKSGKYSSDYKISIDGYQYAAKKTLDNSVSGNADDIRTNTIATDLETQLDANLGGTVWAVSTAYGLGAIAQNGGNTYICTTAGTSAASGGPTGTGTAITDGTVVWDFDGAYPSWDIQVQNATIWLRRTDGADFEIKITDSHSSDSMKLAKDTVQRFTDLPTTAPTGFIVEVLGDNSSSFDNYFVKFVSDNTTASFDSGSWEETVAPGLEISYDTSTTPHNLIRNTDGTFTFSEAAWTSREVGDIESNPDPSFIGGPINNIFFWKNRLGFLTDHNLILSEAGEYFNFFRTTVTTTLDNAPIDVASNHTKVATLASAVPFDDTVILLSDTTLFRVTSGDTLTTKTISIDPLKDTESEVNVQPVIAGDNVYFAQKQGGYTGIREFLNDKANKDNETANITGHCPKYLVGRAETIIASSTYDALAVKTDGVSNEVYLYNYFWNGNEKLQSAWGRWVFSSDAEILDISFLDEYLYFVVQYSDGVYIERVRFDVAVTDTDADFMTLIDRRVKDTDCTVVFDSGTNQTTITVPYSTDTTAIVSTRADGGSTVPGRLVKIVSTSGTSIILTGDYSSTPMWIGQTYSSNYTFSEQTMRERKAEGAGTTIGTGRLQLLRFYLRYSTSSYFRVEVTPLYKNTRQYEFTGRILGSGNNILNSVALESGVFRFPIKAKSDRVSIELINDSHLPCHFQSTDWEANFTNRSQRV